MAYELVVLDDYQGLAEAAGLAARLSQTEVKIIREHLDGDRLVAELSGAAIVVAMRERTAFGRELLSRLPALQLLVTTGMRNAAIDLAAARDLGVTVCGTSQARSASTAELAWGLILSLVRHLPREIAAVRDGHWQQTAGLDLLGSRLALLGAGRIGSQMARIGSAFGMEVVAWSPHLDQARAGQAGARLVSRDELFSQADVLSVHLVLGPATRGLVGLADLQAMKPTAYLVNTARGPIVDAGALHEALSSGWIAGAGLDVFDTEPWPAADRLRSAPNLIATPHLGYVTERVMTHWYGDIVANVEAWLMGTPSRVLTADDGAS
jgi:phosphoglycerate dehydrogenase-like enzyme